MKSRSWEDNAHEFKALSKQGYDVRLGVLVACSVGAGEGQTTAAQFASQAGCSTHTVTRYQTAWDKMVKAGWDVPRDRLTPAMADVESLVPPEFIAEWDALPKGGHAGLADRLGISPGAAAIVNSSEENLKAAVLASPKVARAAEQALLEQYRRHHRLPPSPRDSAPVERPSYWLLSDAHAALFEFIKSQPSQAMLSYDIVSGFRREMREMLDELDQAESGAVLLNADEALERWAVEATS